MIYTLFAKDAWDMPEAVRQETVDWIKEQGVDPGRLAALAFNPANSETWFRIYKDDPWGRTVVLLDGALEPEYEEFFIPLQGKPPRQLEYFIPSEQPPAWLGPPSDIVMWD